MIFKTNYRLMQVKSIAECSTEHSSILSTFIKLPFVIKIFILSIFEWPFYTGFTEYILSCYQDFSAKFNTPETGPRSADGKMYGNRCESDCRSRGCEFDTGPVPYFRRDRS